jgi:hypothetical protein
MFQNIKEGDSNRQHYFEIFNPDNHARSEAGLSGFFKSTTFKSLTRCGNSGSESAVISAAGTFS